MNGRRTLTVLFVMMAAFVALGLWVDARADVRGARAEARNPPEGRFVDVDGTSIHAVTLGKSGPWIVLLHGASGNLRDWTFSFAHELASDHRVIVFDRPGLGYSDRTDPDYSGAFKEGAESPAEQARVLARAAELLGAENPIVVGHSYGGSVAMAWALDHPAAGIVLVAGVALPWPGGLDWTYRVVGTSLGGAVMPPLAAAFLWEGYLETNLRGVFAPQPVPRGYLAGGGVELATRARTIRANGRQVARLRPFVVDQSERYDDLSLPIEAVHGTADTIVPADIHAIPLSERLANVELTLVEGMGHMPHHTHPEVVLAAVGRVIARAALHRKPQPLE